VRRTKEDAAVTREQLLNAALKCFSSKGYTETTLEDVARRASTTRGAIHWHFGNKAELFNALIRERYKHAAVVLQDFSMKGDTPLQILRNILEQWLSYAEDNSDFKMTLELLLLKTEVSPELERGINEKLAGTHSSLKQFSSLIRQGIALGEIRSDVDPDQAAIAALGLINGVVSMWILDQNSFSLKGLAREVIDLFIRGIKNA
jgi:TetR/AcrR family acrAB operon transcriptional repressor